MTKWDYLSSFHILLLSYGPQIVKKVHFLRFCAGFSKKSDFSRKAIYIYASKRLRYAISENDIVYYTMSYCSGDIMFWIMIQRC